MASLGRSGLRCEWQLWGMRAVFAAVGVCLPLPTGSAQTLARPGWAGSGMKVAQWWRNAVVVEVSPTKTAEGSVLNHTRLQLGDLQTLGTDALLLRGMDPGVDSGPAAAAGQGNGAGQAELQLAAGYGTMEEFDQLMREASGRRIRLMVELPGTVSGTALPARARFWLNRGVSGVYVGGAAGQGAETVHALHAVLRSYAGDRVLAGDARSGSEGEAASGAREGETPEMVFSSLEGFGGGERATDVAALRRSIMRAGAAGEAARRPGAGGSVTGVDPASPEVSGEEAKARATALLLVSGSVALRAQDVGAGPEEQARLQAAARDAAEARAIAGATSPAAAANARRAAAARKASAASALELPGDATFAWYQRMVGLHRGNSTMLAGQQTLLDRDSAVVLVSVWQGRSGQPLVAVVNLQRAPATVVLTDDFARLRLRGHFLRTVVRSDAGMGAMALSGLKVPGYGVYLGQLGR